MAADTFADALVGSGVLLDLIICSKVRSAWRPEFDSSPLVKF